MVKFVAITIHVVIYIFYTVISAPQPVGQNPSIVYAPFTPNPFLIFNGAQGLQSVYCEDYKCDHQNRQWIKNNSKLFSTSLVPINYKSTAQNCSKIINNKLYYCTYYMIVGYATLNQNTNTNRVSFVICYDNECNSDRMDEIIIDASTDSSHLFGYSISLTTYYNNETKKLYPMFTYSKYNNKLKQYILNTIICEDFFCNSFIGKHESPPYVVLGLNSKGRVSIQETWYKKENYLSVMFGRNLNSANELRIGSCSLSTSNINSVVITCSNLIEKELECKSIFNNAYGELKINDISMVEYPLANSKSNVPIMIASYIINNNNTGHNELWMIYCFNVFCNSINMLSYKVWTSQVIDYPVISIHYQYYSPSIAFFVNSYALNIMSCEYQPTPWNCTIYGYNHPTYSVYENNKFQTSSMQISITSNPYSFQESLLIFSMVQQQNIFNGSEYINCQTSVCTINQQKHIQ